MAELVGQLIGAVSFTDQEVAAFPQAAKWLFGVGLPVDANGKDGDLYLDTETGDIYQKENGTWA